MKSTADSYGSGAILLHWVSAILVAVLIVSGFRSATSVEAAEKVAALRVHLPVAIAVLVLTIGRLLWWWKVDRKPDDLAHVPAWQAVIARWTHRGLYVLLILMLASGIATSAMTGLPLALFGDAPMPVLSEVPPRAGHGIGARILVLAVLLHGGAALYHHLALRDRTLRRMWFGGR